MELHPNHMALIFVAQATHFVSGGGATFNCGGPFARNEEKIRNKRKITNKRKSLKSFRLYRYFSFVSYFPLPPISQATVDFGNFLHFSLDFLRRFSVYFRLQKEATENGVNTETA
jgi:hypothetical protein